MVPRRVVTALRGQRSVFASDGPPPNAHSHDSLPGFMTSVLWATPSIPLLPQAAEESAPRGLPILPGPGETRLMIVRFPPDAVMAAPDFDPAAAAAEQAVHLPGLAERFEANGMHATDSVDYDIVLEGEIWLELDDGAEMHLRQGDVVVQGGTRHAWRNKSDKAATMAFVLIGARRLS